MSKQNFDHLMNKFTSEAEEQWLEEECRKVQKARNARIKKALLSLGLVGLVVFALFKHAEIRDLVAQLQSGTESPYQGIMDTTKEVAADNSGTSHQASDPSNPNAKFKAALQNAKAHNDAIDRAMDDNMSGKSK